MVGLVESERFRGGRVLKPAYFKIIMIRRCYSPICTVVLKEQQSFVWCVYCLFSRHVKQCVHNVYQQDEMCVYYY